MWLLRKDGCLDGPFCGMCHADHDMSYSMRKRYQKKMRDVRKARLLEGQSEPRSTDLDALEVSSVESAQSPSRPSSLPKRDDPQDPRDAAFRSAPRRTRGFLLPVEDTVGGRFWRLISLNTVARREGARLEVRGTFIHMSELVGEKPRAKSVSPNLPF